jgi:VIT1/CCC1 family predicted Fe2+/Mn2+ transporter
MSKLMLMCGTLLLMVPSFQLEYHLFMHAIGCALISLGVLGGMVSWSEELSTRKNKQAKTTWRT